MTVLWRAPRASHEILGPGDIPDEGFAGIVLDAYETRRPAPSLDDLEPFARLLEASLYIQYRAYWKDRPGSKDWLQLFFEDRRESIVDDRPYLVVP